jgi:hypothetical protein
LLALLGLFISREEDYMKSISRVVITFRGEGIDLDITYTHNEDVALVPGSKGRTSQAANLASMALERAQEHLRTGRVIWGGFGTNMRTSTDRILVDKRRIPR